tara:strand:- start:204 stop:461 length:258 start_codon:yes stop_codon:yes gene_type:complete
MEKVLLSPGRVERRNMKMNEHTFDHLMCCISEGNAKMEMIEDYLKRFEIKDTRITAPITDISRVLLVIQSVAEDDMSGESEVAKI